MTYDEIVEKLEKGEEVNLAELAHLSETDRRRLFARLGDKAVVLSIDH